MGAAIQARTNAKNRQAREHLVKPGALRVSLHLLPVIVPNASDYVSKSVYTPVSELGSVGDDGRLSGWQRIVCARPQENATRSQD